ncbi:MAG: response regulator [Armatimonadetes bacterium]|nr:response regulator [Armatimonadota bacterium]
MAEAPIRVLLLEDDLDDAFLLRVNLDEAAPGQFALEHVTRVSEALQRLAVDRPDVVLSDLGVPDSQGLDTFRSLRNAAPSTAIVVLTGLDDRAVAVRAVQEGAQDYLSKGRLDGPVLVRSLQYAIERQRVSHYRAVLLERERFDSAISHMSDGIVVTDGEGRITTANRAACLLLHVPPGEAQGRALAEVLAPFTLSTPWAELAVAKEHADGFEIERSDTLPPLYLSARLTRLFDGDRLESTVLALRDVTEERRQQELQASFFMMVSHKLRTPLTVLMACLDLCRRAPAQEAAGQLAEVLGVCDLEVQRLGEIVQKLLEFKAVSAQDVSAGGETTDVAAVVAATAEAVERRHGGREVSFRFDLSPSLRPVACGAEHLGLVLDKLLDNAVKFAIREPVEVTVAAAPGAEGWVCISVTDNGPGIPHEYFDRIFQPFVQVEDLPTGQVPGVGVGLSICRQVVEALGGSISVASQLGEGSTFTFTIPVEGEPQRDAEAP